MRPMPTRVGDVLILRTQRSFDVSRVALVTVDGQQDLKGKADSDVHSFTDEEAAVTFARSIQARGMAIYVRHLDTNAWSRFR